VSYFIGRCSVCLAHMAVEKVQPQERKEEEETRLIMYPIF
jgi:hypothetical protein